MKILIVFDTYSGGTLDAATFITNKLKGKGHDVVVKRANEVAIEEFSGPDLIIFGTPSWFVDEIEGKPHEHFEELMNRLNKADLHGKKIAIFGLGDETYAHFCGGVDILEKFITERKATNIIKPLKLDNYFPRQDECHSLLSSWIDELLKVQ